MEPEFARCNRIAVRCTTLNVLKNPENVNLSDSVTTNSKRTFMETRLRLLFCLFLASASALGPARIGAAAEMGENRWVDPPCHPFSFLTEFFDGVTPPTLPAGWSSMTWATSNSGVPVPPADTLPNAAFVDDPATISDKQLLSPNITLICDAGAVQVSFRNNFKFQDGFDGGVLEVSYDDGLTFQDVLAVGGTFVLGGYNGTIDSCCGNPLAGRQAWTGNSAGFIDTTVVSLPGGCLIQFIVRWRMGSDSSVSGEGWRIDNVDIAQCNPPPVRRRPDPRPRPTPR
jgi:hypothetical protein